MKTLGIKAVSGVTNPTVLDDAILPVTLNTSSLGSLVLDIIDNSTGLLCIAVDFYARKVKAKAAVATVLTAAVATINGSAGAVGDPLAFSKVDTTKRSSEWTFEGTAFAVTGGDADSFQDCVKPTNPVLSTGQLIGAFEDAMLTVGGPLEGAFIVATLDQGSGYVTVIKFDTAAHAAAAITAGIPAPTVAYEQIPAVTTGTVREPLG